ncbi:MAG: M56 family metallopeptidase [Salinivirgaceae bacterium]|jgi:TonB family protein
MDSLVLMLLESSVAIALFYGYYQLFLHKETFFMANRLYLLVSALVSILIPWITISIQSSKSSATLFYNLLETVTITATGYEMQVVHTITGWQWASLIYLAGVVVLSLLFIVRLLQVAFIAKNGLNSSNQTYPSNVVLVDKSIIPFSFLNRIYINGSKYSKEQVDKIIAHELVHIRQRHTFDCLFYELLIVLFWFHPIVYRYRKSAKEIHEFLADQGAIQSGIQKADYQELLFAQATGMKLLTLPNSFNYSLIKRRLIMLKKIKSSKWAKIRFVWVAPILVLTFVVFACNKATISETTGNINTESADINKSVTITELDTTVFFIVEDMPEYLGGDSSLREFIAQSVKYPEVAKQKGIQGRVFVQFVVNQNGGIEQVKVVRGVDPSLDEEAIRVVKGIPQWTPGKQNGKNVNVSFTIPINFKLK